MIFDALELNYSKINAYLSCPLLYRFIYVNRHYAPPTGPSSFGLSLHHAIAAYHAEGRSFGDLMVYYQDCWLHQGYETPQQAMEYYRMGVKILEKWHGFHRQDTNKVLYWEKNFRFEFERWTIKGTIDRIDLLPGGGAEIIDYKTGLEGQPRTEEQTANSLQLGMYALAAEEAFGLKPEKITYYILSVPQKVSVPYTKEIKKRTIEAIRNAGTKILEDDYSWRGKCEHCPIRNVCWESSCREEILSSVAKPSSNIHGHKTENKENSREKHAETHGFGISLGDILGRLNKN